MCSFYNPQDLRPEPLYVTLWPILNVEATDLTSRSWKSKLYSHLYPNKCPLNPEVSEEAPIVPPQIVAKVQLNFAKGWTKQGKWYTLPLFQHNNSTNLSLTRMFHTVKPFISFPSLLILDPSKTNGNAKSGLSSLVRCGPDMHTDCCLSSLGLRHLRV